MTGTTITKNQRLGDDSGLVETSELVSSSFGWLTRPNKYLAMVCILMTVVLGYGASRLDLTTDNRVFFGKNNPQLQAFESFEDTYNESNNLLIVFHDNGKDIFNKNALEAVSEFTKSAWLLPHANRVNSLTNYPYSSATDDEIVVDDLVPDDIELNEDVLGKIRTNALADPIVAKRLVSEDAKTAAVHINFLYEGTGEKEAIHAIIEKLDDTISSIESKYPELGVYKTGDIVLGNTVEQATNDDVSILIPLMLITMFVLIGLVLRSVLLSLSVLAVVLLAVISSLGLAGWLGYILNPGSAIAPTIIITIAIADSVHIVSNTLDAMRRGMSKSHAIIDSLRINLLPVTLTTVTTAAGFLTLNFSDSPPFNDLGNIVAIGTLAAFLHTMLVLPWLLSLLPLKVKSKQVGFSAFEMFGNVIIKNRILFALCVCVVVLISSFGLTKIVLTDEWVTYFDDRYEFRTDTDFIIANHSGVEAIEFSVPSSQADGISKIEYLDSLDQFTTWLRQQENVDYAYSIADTIKRLNKNMHGDDDNYYALPDQDDHAAQYLLLYEMSLPYGQDLQDRIDSKRQSTRVTAVGDFSSAEHRELEHKAQDWFYNNAPDYMSSEATGMATLFSHISKRNIDTMLFGTLLLLVGISIALIVVLGNIKYGLISLIPNVVPPLAAVGLWGWVYGELGMAVAVVGAITLGIIVDDTIHMLTKYKAAKVNGQYDVERSLLYMFRVVGKPMFVTTLALVLGFGVLSFSGFQVNWAMGVLAAWTIAFAFITDLILVPAILWKLDSKDASRA